MLEKPPSSDQTCPVTRAAASESSQTISSASSSGAPMPGSGYCRAAPSRAAGLAMSLPDLSDRQRSAWFAWSVVPALIAWPAVLFSPPLAAPLLVFGFIAHYLQDRRLASQARLPDWYLPLRLRLSCVACICLVAGVFACV